MTERVAISFNNTTNDVVNLFVIDMMGKVWYKGISNGTSESIDISRLPAGIYSVQVQKDRKMKLDRP